MRKFVGFVFVLCLVFAGAAQASPLQLAGDINGGGFLFCATDNNVGCANGNVLLDLNPAIGVLDLGTVTIGGLTVEGSLHSDVFGGPLNILNSSSLTIRNNTASAITLESSISADNFPGVTSFIANSGSGTWQTAAGSSALYSFYADTANGIGGQTATDRPGVQISNFNDTAVGLVDSFSVNFGPAPFAALGPFSMTLGFDMTLVGGGSIISRGQTQLTDAAAVPEPLSLSLLGMGLAGLGYRLRRRRAA
jgi:hypothetical protein